MMWTCDYDLTEGIIWVTVHIFGPRGDRYLDCILDTGSPQSIIDVAILDSLGYSAQMGTRTVILSGIGGRLRAYELPIQRFETMGLVLTSFSVLAQNIVPDNLGVEGLIGMDLIVERVLTIDGQKGRLTLGD